MSNEIGERIGNKLKQWNPTLLTYVKFANETKLTN